MPMPDTPARAALLLLADGRFPAGAYAHSGGLEPTIASGDVRTIADLEAFLVGRLRTVGLVAAAFAAAACRIFLEKSAQPGRAAAVHVLDEEYDARTPSPAQRATSRQLGRQLVRALSSVAPGVDLEGLGSTPHQPIALGAGHAVVGLGSHDAALASLHEAAAGPVAAAVRLLSVEPFETHGILARLGPIIDELTAQAVERCTSVQDLPIGAGPLLDTNAERHRTRQTRLFAS